jgi:flagellar basal-body rod protein FlgB
MIDNGTIAQVGLALDVTALRHQAIAQNIANANTPGYRPVTVAFAEQVRALQGAAAHGAPDAGIATVRPTLQWSGADSVSLDMEMAHLSENTLQHQVLLKALSKQFALLGSAIAEGKR